MQNLKQRTKTVALVAAMALMLSPFVASAQGGGLFGLGKTPTETTENGGIMNRSGTGGYNLNNQQFGSDNGGYQLSNQTFGQETPVGSGIAILMLAGAGYAAMKSRNKKSNK